MLLKRGKIASIHRLSAYAIYITGSKEETGNQEGTRLATEWVSNGKAVKEARLNTFR